MVRPRLVCAHPKVFFFRAARLSAALVLLGTLVASRPARAWYDDGHRIVAEIARRHLSDSARAKIDALLADMPAYSSMAEAATWADQQARNDDNFKFINSSHYVNVEAGMTPRELHARCLERAGCVATAVAYYVEMLRS